METPGGGLLDYRVDIYPRAAMFALKALALFCRCRGGLKVSQTLALDLHGLAKRFGRFRSVFPSFSPPCHRMAGERFVHLDTLICPVIDLPTVLTPFITRMHNAATVKE